MTTFINTWEGVKAAAKKAGAKFPEVVAAQWALESAYGTATSGKNNFFGVNCSIKPGIIIGDYNLIGMGSVVLNDIPNYEIWVGNPAKKLRDNLFFKRK